MEMKSIAQQLQNNAYPGRGIILGKTPDGTKAVAAIFYYGKKRQQPEPYFCGGGPGHPYPGV